MDNSFFPGYTINMKKLLLLIILSCLLLPLQAKIATGDLHQQLQRRLEGQLSAGTPSQSAREKQITDALAKEVFRTPKTQNWDYFLTQNKLIQQAAQTDIDNTLQLLYHQYDTDCHLFRKNLGRHLWGKFRLNYAKETRGIKYIYVAEASNHDTKTIPAEVSHLLQRVRHANPHARILLALESAWQNAPDQLPLRFAHSSTQPFELVHENYAPLLTAADRADIDILGLDDFVSLQKEEVKIGDVIIQTPFQKPEIQYILTQYDPEIANSLTNYQRLKTDMAACADSLSYCRQDPQDAAQLLNISLQALPEQMAGYENALAHYQPILNGYRRYLQSLLLDFLARSNWGILQRNRQWARYINAISPFYDIVITYAGNGHLGNRGDVRNVPDLIAKPYILFNFYTTEQLPQERHQYYEHVEQIQEEESATFTPVDNISLRKDVENEIYRLTEMWDQIGYRQAPQGKESEHYYFEEIKFTHLTPEERNEVKEQCRQFSLPPSYVLVSFDVYLIVDEKP